MASMTDYLENKRIDAEFRGGTYTPPSTYYVGLFTAAPSDAGGGTEVGATGTAYARQAVANSASAWKSTQGDTSATSTGTSGTTSNVAAIPFPTATGTGFGTVTHLGIFDALTGGNLLYWAPLAASQSIPAGVAYSIGAGQLSLQVDN